MAVVLEPHQETVLEKMHDGCVLTGGVGVGKTVTALAYYWKKILGAELNNPLTIQNNVDILVITTARKRDELDWQEWGSNFFLHSDPEMSVNGITMTVDSCNNIAKYEKVKDVFLILDEQRMVGSGVWVRTFLKMAKANRWIMLSATPGDTWMDYIPLFVANGFYKNRTDFKEQHCEYVYTGKYPILKRYRNVGRLIKFQNKVLVDMPYKRHTTRHIHINRVPHDVDTLRTVTKKRWNPYKEEPLLDAAELYATARKIVNSDLSRLEELQSLMQKHPRLIVFYNFDYELQNLRSLANGTIPIAEWNGHKHQPVPETDSWLYFVQYAAGAEAWNCVATDAIVFYSLTYSYRQFEQAQGRIDRMNTPYSDLHYYVLVSHGWIDDAILAAVRRKEDFNEKKHLLNT